MNDAFLVLIAQEALRSLTRNLVQRIDEQYATAPRV
jgi:hypothetical protein